MNGSAGKVKASRRRPQSTSDSSMKAMDDHWGSVGSQELCGISTIHQFKSMLRNLRPNIALDAIRF